MEQSQYDRWKTTPPGDNDRRHDRGAEAAEAARREWLGEHAGELRRLRESMREAMTAAYEAAAGCEWDYEEDLALLDLVTEAARIRDGH